MTGKDDYKALISGHKHTRVNPHDGYTIVFLSASDNKKYLHAETDDINGIKKLKTYPADEELKRAKDRAVEEIHSMGAKLRIIDFDHPSAADQKYLAENNIKIPAEPDIFIRYGNKKQMHSVKESGDAPYPGRGRCINIAQGDAEYATYHEIGHALGLKHPFDKEEKNKTLLTKDLDNTDNTSMSYTQGSRNQTDFKNLDAAALRDMYGKQPGYDGLFEKLAHQSLGFPSNLYTNNGFVQQVFNYDGIAAITPNASAKVNEINLDNKTVSVTEGNGQVMTGHIKNDYKYSGEARTIYSYSLPIEGTINCSKDYRLSFNLDEARPNSTCNININSDITPDANGYIPNRKPDVNILGSGSTTNAMVNINVGEGKANEERESYINIRDDAQAKNISINFTDSDKLFISPSAYGYSVRYSGPNGNSWINIESRDLYNHPQLLLEQIKINSVPLSKLGYEIRPEQGGGAYVSTKQAFAAEDEAFKQYTAEAKKSPYLDWIEEGLAEKNKLVEEVMAKTSKILCITDPAKLRESLNAKLSEVADATTYDNDDPGFDGQNAYLKQISKQLDEGKLPDFLDGKKIGFNYDKVNTSGEDMALIIKKAKGLDLGA